MAFYTCDGTTKSFARGILLVSLIFIIYIYSNFLQYLPTSTRLASPCHLPSPRLFPEFERHLAEDVTFGNSSAAGLESCGPLTRAWMPAPYRKAVIFIVDALRFEWLAYQPHLRTHSFSDKEAIPLTGVEDNAELPLLAGNNNFGVAHNLLRHPSQKNHARLFRVLCDIPTVTTQRLRSLMSGNVPPYFDISKSFTGTFAHQDSLPLQLNKFSQDLYNHSRGRPVAVLGDDTWERTFGDFLESVFIDNGYLLTDYDTIDEGVHQRLWKLMHLAKTARSDLEYYDPSTQRSIPLARTKVKLRHDWEWLIAHTLGSDHICHNQGVKDDVLHQRFKLYDWMSSNFLFYLSDGALGSDVMSRWLPSDSDTFQTRLPRNLTQTLKGQTGEFPTREDPDVSRRWADDTVFFLMGDHGMTDTGNHGGSLKHEVEAGLFSWSSRGLPRREVFEDESSHLSSQSVNALTNPTDPYIDPSRNFEKERGYSMRSFDQVDFTTTAAFLLGIPIPTGSIGNIIVELFPIYDRRSYWTDHTADGNRKYEHARSGTADLVSLLECDNTTTLSYPMSERFPELAELECQASSASTGSSFSASIRREDEAIVEEAQIAPLSWLRHLKYLVAMHHVQAWNIHNRVREVGDIAIIEDAESRRHWARLTAELDPMLRKLPSFTMLDMHEEELKNGLDEPELRLRALDEIRRMLEEGHRGIQTHIALLTDALDTYRAFIFRNQDLLRQAEMSSIDVTLSFYGSLIPLVIALILMILQVFGKPRPRPLRSAHARWSLRMTSMAISGFIFALVAKLSPAFVFEGSLSVVLGRIRNGVFILDGVDSTRLAVEIFICLVVLLESSYFVESLSDIRRRVSEALLRTPSDIVAGSETGDENLLGEETAGLDEVKKCKACHLVPAETSGSRKGWELLWDHAHIAVLVTFGALVHSHGLSINHADVTTRFILQCLCLFFAAKPPLIVAFRGLPVNWKDHRLNAALWIAVAILARIDMSLDFFHKSPGAETPRSVVIDQPAVIVPILCLSLVLFLRGLLSETRGAASFRRLKSQLIASRESDHVQEICRLTDFLTLKAFGLAPATKPSITPSSSPRHEKETKLEKSSTSLSDALTRGHRLRPVKAESFICPTEKVEVRGGIDLFLCLTWTWMTILACIHVTGYYGAEAENTADSNPLSLFSHPKWLTSLASVVGFSDATSATLSLNKLVTLISARMAAATLLLELVVISSRLLKAQWREQIRRRIYLILSVTLFQAFVFLQIPREASVFALQVLKIPLLALAFQMTIMTASKRNSPTVALVAPLGDVLGNVVDEMFLTGERLTAELKGHTRNSHSRKPPVGESKAKIASRYVITDNELVITLIFFGYNALFSTGHRSDFSALPYPAGFVGTIKAPVAFSVVLIALHCVAAQCLSVFLLAHFTTLRPSLSSSLAIRIKTNLYKYTTLLTVFSIGCNAITLFDVRDFLPAWRDYAPKILAESTYLLFVIATTFYATVFTRHLRAESSALEAFTRKIH